jgi:hypothetical protein
MKEFLSRFAWDHARMNCMLIHHNVSKYTDRMYWLIVMTGEIKNVSSNAAEGITGEHLIRVLAFPSGRSLVRR